MSGERLAEAWHWAAFLIAGAIEVVKSSLVSDLAHEDPLVIALAAARIALDPGHEALAPAPKELACKACGAEDDLTVECVTWTVLCRTCYCALGG